MAGQQSPSRMLIMLPAMFFMSSIDFEDPIILLTARVAYYSMQALTLVAAFYIQQRVKQVNDQRKIFVPGQKNPFDQSANAGEYVETTYSDHESSKASELIKQTVMGVGIASFIHFKFEINPVLVIQTLMAPMNLYDNPLIQKHVFGKTEQRVWEEKLEGEPLDAPVETEATSTDATASTSASDKSTADMAPEEAIAKAVSDVADADFDQLWQCVKKDVNVQTKEDGWTALMVACGSPIDTDEFIRKCIKAGADTTAVDSDGWTALHWSSFHGRPEAAETLLECCTSDEREDLMKTKANDGQTPREVAKGEGNDDVVEVLDRYIKMGSADKGEEDATLRQRKPATTVEDVD